MKKKIIDHLTLAIIFLFVLSVARWKLDFGLLFLWLGGILGSLLLETDYLFQVFLVQPKLPISLEMQKLWSNRQYKTAITTVFNRTNEIKSLTFHTLLFQVIFYAFSFFVLTSSGSVFGQALVLTSLLHLLKEQVGEIRAVGELGKDWFSRINLSLSVKGQKIYLGIAVFVFLLFTTFAIR